MSDEVPLVPRGWDVGPTIPMGPSPWPSWNARTMGISTKGDLYTYTYTPDALTVGQLNSPGHITPALPSYLFVLIERLGLPLHHISILFVRFLPSHLPLSFFLFSAGAALVFLGCAYLPGLVVIFFFLSAVCVACRFLSAWRRHLLFVFFLGLFF